MSKLEREKTMDLNSMPSWGKLVPLNSGLSSFELVKPAVVIGRVSDCDIVIVDKRLSSQHCQIEKTQTGIVLKDLSSNGTYIDKLKIGKNNEINLSNGTQFWLLPASRVKPTEAIGFKLEIPSESDRKSTQINGMNKQANKSQIKQEKKDEQSQKQKELQKQEKAKIQKQRNEQDQQLKQQITCAFCFQIMCIPVSVQPCNHRFCGGCLTELVKKGKGECIKCRKTLTTAVKDASFNSIIDLYLKTHSQDKRDAKDVEEQTAKNIFTFDPTDIVQMITGKPAKKKVVPPPPVNARGSRRRVVRAGSDLSASDQDEARCRQCMTSRNGFQCASGQKHVGCLTCGKLMADRDNRSLHQNCVLCTQYFCNLYYPPCSKTGVKLKQLLTFRNEAKIDKQLLRANTFEFESIRNYLMSKKLTSKQVFDFVMQKIEKNEFAYLFDRKIMRIAPTVSKEVKLEADDSVCDSCWKDLWFQMVFFYRTQKAADMPSSVRDRPTCYWGINCKTMSHKEDHAKTYNHMVFQSRF